MIIAFDQNDHHHELDHHVWPSWWWWWWSSLGWWSWWSSIMIMIIFRIFHFWKFHFFEILWVQKFIKDFIGNFSRQRVTQYSRKNRSDRIYQNHDEIFFFEKIKCDQVRSTLPSSSLTAIDGQPPAPPVKFKKLGQAGRTKNMSLESIWSQQHVHASNVR